MGLPAASVLLLASLALAAGETFVNISLNQTNLTSYGHTSCDPGNKICHTCTRLCSRRTDDSQLALDTHCRVKCRNAADNCHQRHSNEVSKREKCLHEELRQVIEEFGDIPMKVLYGVAPTFDNFDRLDTPDGCVRKADMQRLRDVLDGSNEEGGFALPTAKGNVWAIWEEADKDKDGCVSRQEFDTSKMGEAFRKAMPAPSQASPMHDLAEATGESISDAADVVGDAASSAGGAIADGAENAGEHIGDVAEDVHDSANPPDETISGEATVKSAEFMGNHRRHRPGTSTK